MPKKELPEQTKRRLEKQAIEEITFVCLTHEIKIESTPAKYVKLYMALYQAGLSAGAKEMMKAFNENDNVENIKP